MKGYFVEYGYMGYVDGKYQLFADEQDYREAFGEEQDIISLERFSLPEEVEKSIRIKIKLISLIQSDMSFLCSLNPIQFQ